MKRQHGEYQSLTAVASIRRSTLQPDQFPDDALYVGLEHIESGTGAISPVPAAAAGLRSAKNRFEVGDVLFGKLRPNLRKAAVAKWDGVCSTDILVLKPIADLTAHLIAIQLRSKAMLPAYERLVAGASLPRLAARDLGQLEVWVPEPARIAALDQQARMVEALRDAVSDLVCEVAELEYSLERSLPQGTSRSQS